MASGRETKQDDPLKLTNKKRKMTIEDKVKQDGAEIPPVITEPESTPVPLDGRPAVFFDLETTGFADESHITQIGAVGPSGSFSTYVLPKTHFEPGASEVTGMWCDGGILYHNGEAVDALVVADALSSFFNFLGDQAVILYGHNCKKFDVPKLIRAVKACSLDSLLTDKVAGFIDTLTLFQAWHPGLASHKQERLYSHFFNESYAAHGAEADAEALKRLVEHNNFPQHVLAEHSFSCLSAVSSFDHAERKRSLYQTFQPLIAEGAMSKDMANKAADTGLGVDHLKSAFRQGGTDEVESVLSQQTPGKRPRVTKQRSSLTRISDYIKKLSS